MGSRSDVGRDDGASLPEIPGPGDAGASHGRSGRRIVELLVPVKIAVFAELRG